MKNSILKSTTVCALALSVATLLIPASASANLIIDGGFEDPALAPGASINALGSPWVIVAPSGSVITYDATTGTLHNGLIANSVGDNVMILLTASVDYVYQTVAVTPGDSYTLSFLQGKGGDFFRSRGQRASITDITNTTFFFSTGYLFPSTNNDGSGTDVLFPASLTFTPTTSTINVRLDSTAGTRTLSEFDEIALVNNTVPEPTSAVLLFGSGAMLLARRRSAQA